MKSSFISRHKEPELAQYDYGDSEVRERVEYMHLIRNPRDPMRHERLSKHSNEQLLEDINYKLNKCTPGEWAVRICKCLSDGSPRTFNRIMVEEASVTADIAFRKNPEHGLWLAVRNRWLQLAITELVWFKAGKETNRGTLLD